MSRATSSFVLLLVASGCAASTAPRSSSSLEPAAAPLAPDLPTPPANFFGDFTMGFGKYEHDTDGGTDGDTDGGYLRIRGEYLANMGIGGGLAIEGSGSDDDLFGGNQDSEGAMSDVFAFFLIVPVQTDRFRLPVRAGPYFHNTSIDDDASDTEIDWGGIGGRVEVEPQFSMIKRDNFELALVGDVGLGFHFTQADVDSPGLDDDFDGNGITFNTDVGVEARFARHITTRLSWIYRRTDEDETDDSGGFVVNEAHASFNGIGVSVGVRF